VDFAANTLERTYPRGVDVSVFTFDALEKTHLMAKQPWEREHVTPFMKDRTDLFTQANLTAPGKLFRPDLRITVDTEEDLMLIKAIYYFLGERSLELGNIIDLFDEQPWLPYINRHVKQKEITE
jgi:spore coat polysaccharide biosynthesis protein SpsF (cytidylyltransferase family)